MTATRIAVTRAEPRSHVDVAVGALAPRIVDRGPAHAHVAIAAAGMLLLSGDRVRIDVDVGDGCTLEIDDVGGTVAYPSIGEAATWTLDIRVGEDATLLWHGLPFVIATDADVRRRTTIRCAAGGAVLLRETLVLGRHGEAGGRLHSQLTATDTAGDLLVEHLVLDGDDPVPGVRGTHRVLDAVIALGWRPPARPRDLVLEAPGAVARFLGAAGHESPLDGAWREWRDAIRTRGDAVGARDDAVRARDVVRTRGGAVGLRDDAARTHDAVSTRGGAA
ncbi:urease accessory protein UreD [Microbacterium sp. No. 7]|uniref:urease accessory protein UreD n=1 Tax=Microbacterium sp. No. 7 TaxID=1714373 RepID=UPI0009EA9E30|nr:urease accessory protein UreD [Microbacterium sp. No. 7]